MHEAFATIIYELIVMKPPIEDCDSVMVLFLIILWQWFLNLFVILEEIWETFQRITSIIVGLVIFVDFLYRWEEGSLRNTVQELAEMEMGE
jgi:hypothetical protein